MKSCVPETDWESVEESIFTLATEAARVAGLLDGYILVGFTPGKAVRVIVTADEEAHLAAGEAILESEGWQLASRWYSANLANPFAAAYDLAKDLAEQSI